MESLIHHGRNIKRLREMIGMKQEVLAFELGAHWSQKKISLLEQKKEVGEETIQEVAKALDVPSGMIYQFSEEFVKYLFCQTTNQPKEQELISHFVERWLKATEENQKLYVQLWRTEKEKVKILKKSLKLLKAFHYNSIKG